ncbi:MAG: class I tRNA ligase family protein, partial [Clostridia bacterium]|nr:class I tRNA ligase family protein [Clostridia bacterium]
MFKKVDPGFDFLSREQEVLKLWKEKEIFKKSIDQREGSDVFTFYDGPPTANGKPHIGHIETRVFKDIFP